MPAYRPYCAGTPQTDAYAIPWGTSKAQTDNPARKSPLSHSFRYMGNQDATGTYRPIRVAVRVLAVVKSMASTTWGIKR